MVSWKDVDCRYLTPVAPRLVLLALENPRMLVAAQCDTSLMNDTLYVHQLLCFCQIYCSLWSEERRGSSRDTREGELEK